MTTESVTTEPKNTPEKLEKLREEHRKLDEQIKELTSATYLSTEDQLEVARLKKLKLHAKDEIFQMASSLGIEV
jgi:hypothetical protein